MCVGSNPASGVKIIKLKWKMQQLFTKIDKTFWFDVCYIDAENTYNDHYEQGQFKSYEDAHKHYRKLLNKYQVGGSYYLCKWGEGNYPEDIRGVIKRQEYYKIKETQNKRNPI